MNRVRAAAGLVGTALEHLHLRARRLDSQISQVAFERFISALDPEKAIFHHSDVAELRRLHAKTLAPALLVGDLSFTEQALRRFKTRIHELGAFIRSIEGIQWDRAATGFLERNAERRTFPNSMSEQHRLWQMLLRIAWFEQLLGNDLLPAQTPSNAQKRVIQETLAALKQRSDLSNAKAAIWQINAVAGSFDPHTRLLPPDELNAFKALAEQHLDGVGLVLRAGQTYPQISYVMPGSPSWLQGDIREGDSLIAIADSDGIYRDMAGSSVASAAQRLRGPLGSTIRLFIETRQGARRRIILTRGVIDSPTGRAQGALLRIPGSSEMTFGLITLPMFYKQIDDGPARSASLDLRRLIGEFNRLDIDGLILDLRGNTGGVLEEAVAVAGLFLDGGPIVQLERFRDTPRVLTDPSPIEDFTGPLVVLINRTSASASEIVAAALQDYRRAVIVGTTSFGKGTAQMLMPLDPLLDKRRTGLRPIGALKITRSQFYRVTGRSTQKIGVTPDIQLPTPFIESSLGEGLAPTAIGSSNTTPLRWSPRALPDLTALMRKSRDRVARSLAFRPLLAETIVQTRFRSDTRTPLDFNKWLAQYQKRRKALSIARGPSPRPRLVSISPVQSPGEDDAPEPQAIFTAREVWRNTLSKDPWIAESSVILKNLTDR
jgi:carboxyl-terminal processing protease